MLSKMLKNLELQNGLLLSEKVMFELGKRLGKQSSHSLVYECSMKAFEEARSFKDVLLENPIIKKEFNESEITEWLVPQNYLGSAPDKVDIVIRYAELSGLLD